MSRYLITLRPLEPYFFGNEHKLSFPTGKQSEERTEYYVESENIPSQTTLLGMLRYLVLKRAGQLSKDGNRKLSTDQENLVGKNSFSLEAKNLEFGSIQSIGSMFLLYKDEHCCLPCPLDHNLDNDTYSPFEMGEIKTESGVKLFPKDYVAKKNLAKDYYIRLEGQSLKVLKPQEIFISHEQVGISKNQSDKAFYKRNYKNLTKDYQFAFFAELEDSEQLVLGAHTGSDVVTMGQKQSPFLVTWKNNDKVRDEHNSVLEQLLMKQTVMSNIQVYYAESPIIFSRVPACRFHISQNKTFMYKNPLNGSFKTSMSYIVRAGSIFYVEKDEKDNFESCFSKDNSSRNCIKIGLNNMNWR